MKTKHNKKRNTAFLFEALVREVTKSVVTRDRQRTKIAKSILKEHYKKGTPLSKEMDCYNSLVAEQGIDKPTAEKILDVAKSSYESISDQEIFNEQSQVIKKINLNLGRSVYNNFVPNYRSFATIAQVFGSKTTIKNRVLLEQNIVENMTQGQPGQKVLQPVDSLIINSFSKIFNEKYGGLLEEQQNLLGKYVVSFGASEVDFKIHVANELKRIEREITNSLQMDEIKNDKQMISSTNQILENIKQINVSNISEEDILDILKLQKLVSEYSSDDN